METVKVESMFMQQHTSLFQQVSQWLHTFRIRIHSRKKGIELASKEEGSMTVELGETYGKRR